ncbi:hypothetical protein ES708_16449 [subsurface metagenome]
MKKFNLVLVIALILSLTLSVVVFGAEKWASDVEIIFFAGGDPGCSYASVVYRGALLAAEDIGAQVEYVFSGWSVEKMTSQLREAIARRPDGIAFMGHPGDDAIMPLAKEASEAGIVMMYQNVNLPLVRAKYGGGYVGGDLAVQGRELGEEAIRRFGLKSGDLAIVYGNWGMAGRFIREDATAVAFEEAGLIVKRFVTKEEWFADPTLSIPAISSAILADPEVKIICFANTIISDIADLYMEAAGREADEILFIGYGTTAAMLSNMERGYLHLTSDQLGFMEGYLPILSLALTIKYQMFPLSYNVAEGFVDKTNFREVLDLVKAGYR